MAMTPENQTPGAQGTTKKSADESADEIMKIRKMSGAIAEVIEPVQRTVPERTNK